MNEKTWEIKKMWFQFDSLDLIRVRVSNLDDDRVINLLDELRLCFIAQFCSSPQFVRKFLK